MTREEYRCGHPRDDANTKIAGGRALCRTCANQYNHDAYKRTDKKERYLAYRLRILPVQLDAAERKVAALRNEAARYGMTHLLEGRA